MSIEKIDFRHFMLYEFWQRKKCNKSNRTDLFCLRCGCLNVRVCQKWFAKFRSGDFDIEDKEPSERPQELETDNL